MKAKLSANAKLLGEVKGLKIYSDYQPSKTGRGRDRLWIQIRQEDPKEWKQSTALVYQKAADIQFQK